MKIFAILYGCMMLALAATDEKNFKIENLQLAQLEDGNPLPVDFQFLAGETVFFSCHVSGYAKSGDDIPKIFLTYEVEVRDPKGILVLPPESGKVVADLSPEDKHWRPKIRFTIALPPLVDAGQYQVITKVKDELGKVEAQATLPLLVRGGEVAASDTMVVRNFRFLRSEEDRNPLKAAAYRPGDAVWARFEMTGYKFGEHNHMDVEYGLKVLRPDGDTTYEEQRAASEQKDSFYPQRYQPGSLSLNLPKDLKTGEYTIVLTVRDNIGKQSFETRQKFVVE